ncbi:MAG: putative lipase [Frankiales bacterium]|nr:putative lipase [Frankiales bacterium]
MALTLPFRLIDLAGRMAFRLNKMPSLDDPTAVPQDVRRAQQPMRRVLGPRPTGVRSEDREVPGRDGPLPVRIYTTEAPSGRALLYIHGGGFMVGGIDACDHICVDLAALTNDVIVSVDYRLAPEDPFPAGLDDCEDALHWLRVAGLPGVDVERIAVGGDSAGGNLSAALALRERDLGCGSLSKQVLIYPMLDLTCSLDSWISEGSPYLAVDRVRAAMSGYHGTTDVKDPYVSPLHAPDLRKLPPALVLVAQHDTLREDGVEYAAALLAAGVPTALSVYPRMPHAWMSWPRLTKQYRRSLQEIAAFLAT